MSPLENLKLFEGTTAGAGAASSLTTFQHVQHVENLKLTRRVTSLHKSDSENLTRRVTSLRKADSEKLTRRVTSLRKADSEKLTRRYAKLPRLVLSVRKAGPCGLVTAQSKLIHYPL